MSEPGERWQFRGGDAEERCVREQPLPLRTSEALQAVKTVRRGQSQAPEAVHRSRSQTGGESSEAAAVPGF